MITSSYWRTALRHSWYRGWTLLLNVQNSLNIFTGATSLFYKPRESQNVTVTPHPLPASHGENEFYQWWGIRTRSSTGSVTLLPGQVICCAWPGLHQHRISQGFASGRPIEIIWWFRRWSCQRMVLVPLHSLDQLFRKSYLSISEIGHSPLAFSAVI